MIRVFVSLILLLPSLAFGATWFSCDGQTTCGGTIQNTSSGIAETNISDSSAPDGDGKVWRWTFYDGIAGGRTIAYIWSNAPTSGNTSNEFWVQYYWKYSTGFDYHSVTNKHWYFNPSNTMGMGLQGRSSGALHVNLMPQDPAYSYLPNVNTTDFYHTAGVWYKYTGYFKLNTAGSSNGLYKAWVNDVLVSNYTNVNYTHTTYTVDSGSLTFVAIWGGTGDTFSGPGYLYMDQIYAGTTAPSGGGSTDVTAPYVDTFSPTNGTTGVSQATTSFSFHIKDGGTVVTGVVEDNVSVNCADFGGLKTCASGLTCSGDNTDITVSYGSLSLDYDDNVVCTINGKDGAGNAMSPQTYYFTVEGSPNPPLTVATTSLSSCTVGTSCSPGTLTATGGVPAYTWDTSAGSVPTGLSVPSSGIGAWGTPTAAGTFTATYRVTDSVAATATKSLSLTVVPDPGGGGSQSTTVADTYINSGSDGDDNYHESTELRSYQWPAYTVANRTIIMDNTLSQTLTAGKNIDSATLWLYLTGYDGSGGSDPMKHHTYCSTEFDTTTATWDNFDSTLSEISTTDVTKVAGWFSFDVTSCFRTAYQGRLPMYVAIDGGADGAQDTNRIFASIDHATEALRPRLEVVSSDNIVLLPPNAPTGHSVAAGDAQVTMNPGTSSGALFYTAFYAAGANPTKASTSIVGVVSGQALTGLTNGTQLRFAFTASNASGESDLSTVDIVTPVAASVVENPPDPPSYSSAVGLSGAVILSPGSSPGATSYNAYRSDDGSTPTKSVYAAKITGVTSGYRVLGLTNGTTYKFVFTAVNAAGESDESGVLSVTPQTTLNVNFLIGTGNSVGNVTTGQTKNFLTSP